LWAQVASPSSVEQALARHATAKELAADLNVHFLIRGNVTRVATGYNVEMLVVDGITERVIGTKSLIIAAGTLAPRRREELEDALGALTYNGVEAEVRRAKDKPLKALDVRDLSFRAYVNWFDKKEQKDEQGAYLTASDLLARALTLAPDDPVALFITAQINLCDCVMAWSKNVEEQQAIGEAAMEKYLRRDPTSLRMLEFKASLIALRGRYEESMLIAGSILKLDPQRLGALDIKAYDLLKLGRPQEALAVLNEVRNVDEQRADIAMESAVHYQLGHYELAAQLAKEAITTMSHEELGNPRSGGIGLTLVAAEARLGHLARAKVALDDFNAAVPGVQTISAIKKWMHPAADLAGYDPLFEGLRLAGIPD
jgi:tetratricopeptide (TPR) repeat protein